MIKQRLKVAAVAGAVVLALTGFSRHGGHSHSHSSGGGGGCSGPSHTSSSGTTGGSGSTYDPGSDPSDDPGYGDTTTSGGTYGSGGSYGDDGSSGPARAPRHRPRTRPTQSATGSSSGARATATVVSCASPAAGGRKAVTSSKVRVTAGNGFGGTASFEVDVVFRDAGATVVDSGSSSVTLRPGQVKTVTVEMNTPSEVGKVDSCEASLI
ncbi:hypothetical protein [Streptomyces fuscigenes]|uniref:hypothetical protein n=1 Tax=Streptomyces fuscigenes TaxID=1528880 RepID=UPI001F275FBB|nr:hypothetical protein [Streptomyces fuscigenes]MCF3963127.1 hypothetical protein [Streptomyces fuscigenes]